ncbi:MAG: hypothetical protein AAFZ65_00240, partial [Planctomycetota bacterium]
MFRPCSKASIGLALLAAVATPVAPLAAQEAAAEGAATEPADPPVVLRAERLIVRPGQVLEDVSVLVRDGRILEVGSDLALPEGATVVEGAVVCVGFIDSWSRLGVDSTSYRDRSAGPATRTVDAIDPYANERQRRAVLAAGVVAARVEVGSGASVGAVGAVVANHPGGGLEDLVLSGEACVTASISGSDVFERIDAAERIAATIEQGASYREAQLDYAKELAEWEAAIAEKVEELEDGFKKAKKARDKAIEEAEEEGDEHKEEKYKEDRRPRKPNYDPNAEVMARVAAGELPIVVEAHRAADIRLLLEAMAGFPRVRWVLAGATDAHFLAEELAERKVPVLIAPQRRGLGGSFGADEFELAGQLERAGVPVLLGSDGTLAGRD